MKEAQGQRRKVVYGVTVGKSAFGLLRGQLAWMRERGWDVTLVTSPDEAACRAAKREGVALTGVNMARDISPARDAFALVEWIRVLRTLKPDALNVGTPKASLLGGAAAWLLRVPKRLYVVRGLRLEGTSGILSKVLWMMEWLTMRMATDVLFVSRSLAMEALGRGLGIRSRSWLIGEGSSNGVDSVAVAARATEERRRDLRVSLSIDDGEFVVGFVGRIVPDKGADVLADAVQRLGENSRVVLLAVGPVADSGSGRALESLGSRVRVIPPTDDVWSYMAAMDMLCLPTRREGFPNVVLEAAAAGVPVLTTKATGAVDSVVQGETGLLVDVDDAEAMAREIKYLRDNPRAAQEMANRALVRVKTHFQPASVWAGVAEILEGVDDPIHARPAGVGRYREDFR